MTQQEIHKQPNLLRKLLKTQVKDKPVYVKHNGKLYKVKQLG